MADGATTDTAAVTDAAGVGRAAAGAGSDAAVAMDAVHARCSRLTLPGPKPVRYWRDADIDQLRAAIIELWKKKFGAG